LCLIAPQRKTWMTVDKDGHDLRFAYRSLASERRA